MAYVCLYLDYAETLAPYSLEERGALVTAMLRYASSGELPDFSGPERFIWPTLRAQMDRDALAYAERCSKNRANGSKGGRPRGKANGSAKTDRFLQEPRKPKKKENESSSSYATSTIAPALEGGAREEEYEF